jgi:hypothetical protein
MEPKKIKIKALKSFIDQSGKKIDAKTEFYVSFVNPYLSSKIMVGDVVVVDDSKVSKSKEGKND